MIYTKNDMVEALIYLGKCGDAVAKALVDFGNSLKLMGHASSTKQFLSKAYASAPNNWRKMHGLPMRRRGGQRYGS